MSFIGKLIGGSIGFMFAGPLGALAGAALGHSFDNKNRKLTGSKTDQIQMYFYVATFSLMAKTAKADGRVSEEEIAVINDFIKNNLKLDEQGRDFAIKIFNEAKNNNVSFTEYAKQFKQVTQGKNELSQMLISMLFAIATSDNDFHAEEERIIFEIAQIIGVSSSEYNNLKASYVKDTEKYYKILGCSKNDSFEVIKKKYLKLVKEYHPDKIVSKGLPEEFSNFAKQKFQDIQEAYEIISEENNKKM
ncbi:MAG: TerB family tellurite resistance protein [Candidatus Cloacimonadota bacterium]|nr:TerB family tellurite resistance protein [Candidatus Cloacimonadota bacterium]